MSGSFMGFPHVMELGSHEAVENALTGTINDFFFFFTITAWHKRIAS